MLTPSLDVILDPLRWAAMRLFGEPCAHPGCTAWGIPEDWDGREPEPGEVKPLYPTGGLRCPEHWTDL